MGGCHLVLVLGAPSSKNTGARQNVSDCDLAKHYIVVQLRDDSSQPKPELKLAGLRRDGAGGSLVKRWRQDNSPAQVSVRSRTRPYNHR